MEPHWSLNASSYSIREHSSNNFERTVGAEQAQVAISNALAVPSRLEQRFRAPWPCRAQARAAISSALAVPSAGSSSDFEHPGGAEQARTAISSALAVPSRLEQRFRVPWRSRAGSSSDFERPGEPSKLENAATAAGPERICDCLLYTSPSPRDKRQSRMPSSA